MRVMLLALVVAVVAASPAAGAVATVEDGRLAITAARGANDGVEVQRSSPDYFLVFGATPGPGCKDLGNGRATECPRAGVAELWIDLRDGRDRATARVSDHATIVGGRGRDVLTIPASGRVRGGRGGDVIGSAGIPASSSAEVRGGPGLDVLGIWVPQGSPAIGWNVDLPRDLAIGPRREMFQPLAGIEDIDGSRRGDVLVGDDKPNRISGGRGRDTIRGRGGDDRIEAAGDGARDSIRCGPGRDAVIAGARDRVAADCEDVTRA